MSPFRYPLARKLAGKFDDFNKQGEHVAVYWLLLASSSFKIHQMGYGSESAYILAVKLSKRDNLARCLDTTIDH